MIQHMCVNEMKCKNRPKVKFELSFDGVLSVLLERRGRGRAVVVLVVNQNWNMAGEVRSLSAC